MKKVLGCLAALFISGAVFAANTHFTETVPPASPAGGVPISNGYDWSLTTNNSNSVPPLTLPTYTLAVATTSLTANTTGQIIYVTGTAATPTVCISSGNTTTNQWVILIATGSVCK